MVNPNRSGWPVPIAAVILDLMSAVTRILSAIEEGDREAKRVRAIFAWADQGKRMTPRARLFFYWTRSPDGPFSQIFSKAMISKHNNPEINDLLVQAAHGDQQVLGQLLERDRD